jgi:heme/copper-type cytochrome/quinol oxidase subunit 4
MQPTEQNEPQAVSITYDTQPGAAYRRGAMTLVALAVLTGVEFWASAAIGSLVVMAILGLAKAGIILQYFMHLSSLWREETGHER